MRKINIIILLVLCLTLLLLTGRIVNTVIPETTSGNLENQENTEEPVMWSGLGMAIYSTSDNVWELSSFFDDQVDDLLANGFTQLRIDITYWANAEAIAISKSAITLAISKGAQVIWGVGAAPATLTSTNWPTFRQGILDAAIWAQANGVYEFQLGNEEEHHNDDTTLTDAQLIANLKSVATDVQAIFTNGNVSYSCWGAKIDDWKTAGKGDIDFLASNIYHGGNGSYDDSWKTLITNLVNAFGADGTYLTEFGLSWTGLDDYSADETVQAEAITEMIDYIKASGIKRAIFFNYCDDPQPFGPAGFGALKDDGTYRLLWTQALLNSGSVESTTVPK